MMKLAQAKEEFNRQRAASTEPVGQCAGRCMAMRIAQTFKLLPADTAALRQHAHDLCK